MYKVVTWCLAFDEKNNNFNATDYVYKFIDYNSKQESIWEIRPSSVETKFGLHEKVLFSCRVWGLVYCWHGKVIDRFVLKYTKHSRNGNVA